MAHVLEVDVPESQQLEADRRQAPTLMTCDGGHELIHGVARREDAGDDRARADTEVHVEAVQGVHADAILQALERPHLEVDAGDATTRRTQRASWLEARRQQLVGLLEEMRRHVGHRPPEARARRTARRAPQAPG